ncbi:hypothetical protein BH11PAT2_BH11PAT2_06600 [soil metagenome]
MNNLLRPSDPSRIRIRSDDRIVFAKRLALYLRSGIPIVEALALMTEDSKRGNNTMIVRAVMDDVLKGRALSHSLSAYPRA